MSRIGFVVLVLMWHVAFFYSEPVAGQGKCVENTSLVRITAQQITADSPSYVFLITNLTTSPIIHISFGGAQTRSLRSSQWNIPSTIEGPSGWEGIYHFIEETPYMHYVWDTSDSRKGILPQQSSCSFRITLPNFAERKPTFYEDGTPTRQVDFVDLPFKVVVTEGTAYCGKISVHKLDQLKP
ncbi:MAG: hypothetical protein ACRD1R_18655 [Acidobacteriota bacterium]